MSVHYDMFQNVYSISRASQIQQSLWIKKCGHERQPSVDGRCMKRNKHKRIVEPRMHARGAYTFPDAFSHPAIATI